MIQKAKVLTLIVFGLLFINLSAQGDEYSNDPAAKLPNEDRKFRFGLQFSPNISWFKANTTGYDSEGGKVGFNYGLSFEYFMSKNYLFSTGLSILNANGKISHKGSFGIGNNYQQADVISKYKVKYIEIPLYLKLRTNEIGYLTYYGVFGFNMGVNFGASSEVTYTYELDPRRSITTTTHTVKYSDSKGDINWINMSLVIGAGVEYSISGNTSLTLGLTFNNGFINQLDTKVPILDSNGEALLGADGPIFSEKDASANLNYFALNIGIYF